MSAQTQSSQGTATGTETPGGATPPAKPSEETATGTRSPAPADRERRDADTEGSLDAEERRDAELSGTSLEKALKEERRRARSLEAELRQIREAEQARADAEKTDLQRATERAESAERRVASMEREMLARQVANEAGIPTLWHRLSGDDTRALRADAQRLREEMGLTTGALEGGVRSDGVPAQPQSMDELIRGFGAGRR
jgi:hypothetical protein